MRRSSPPFVFCAAPTYRLIFTRASRPKENFIATAFGTTAFFHRSKSDAPGTSRRRWISRSWPRKPQAFVGRHDFASFAANRGKPEHDTVRTMKAVRLRRRGRCLTIEVEGDGFLYKMVRLMVGALVRVGRDPSAAGEIRALAAAGACLPRRAIRRPGGGSHSRARAVLEFLAFRSRAGGRGLALWKL